MSDRSGIWFALVAAVLFGLSGPVSADLFKSIDPIELAQFRSVVTALVLGVIAYRRRQTATGGRLVELAALGLVLASVTITYYWAIDRLGVGPGVTIQFLGPALVLVWMRLVQRRRVVPVAWAAAALALAGTAMMNRAWDLDRLDRLGVAAGLGAAFTFAAYLVIGERLGKRLPALTVAAYAFALASLGWLAVAPPSIPHHSTRVWVEMGWVAVFGTAVPFLLEFEALRRGDPGQIGITATVEPVVAAMAAWVALGQSLAPVQLAGGALVVTAIATIQRFTHSVAPDAPDLVV